MYGEYKEGKWVLSSTLVAKKKEVAKRKKDLSEVAVFATVTERFWRDTEPLFYDLLAQAQRALEQDAEASLQELRERWLDDLGRQNLLPLFDEVTQYGAFRAADPRAVVAARRNLRSSVYDKKTRQLLGLPSEERGRA